VSKIEYAIKQIEQDESLEKLNLTDPDAPLIKGKKEIMILIIMFRLLVGKTKSLLIAM
jgi:hypothetical protein